MGKPVTCILIVRRMLSSYRKYLPVIPFAAQLLPVNYYIPD